MQNFGGDAELRKYVLMQQRFKVQTGVRPVKVIVCKSRGCQLFIDT